MLIYDHNKQFLGLDNEDLQQLGFSSAAALFEECNDFADLFVKRPGYIHNFKNFEWIDFVLHAEAEDSKAIIHTPKNNFTCKLVIKPFYLNSSPDEHGFMVLLQNLQALSAEEDAKVAHDIEMHPTPKVATPTIASPNMPLPDVSLPNFDDMPSTELSEPDIFDVPVQETSFGLPSTEEDAIIPPFKLDVEDIYSDPTPEEKFEAEAPIPEITKPEPENITEEQSILDSFTLPEEKTSETNSFVPNVSRSNLPDIPMLGDQLSQKDHEYINNLHTNKDYAYDPNVAADELGLPVDLIEEFIGDFIQQSHDFHDELFEKVSLHDRDSIQTLSHKLKGVAANLRIEDAFEVLTIINTSHDFDEITANLKYYYHLIAKLEGKESAFLNLDTDNPVTEEVSETHEKPLEIIEESIETPKETFKEIVETKEEVLATPKEEPQDEEIYSFEMPKDDADIFDIPQKPPVFDDLDDEIYDFQTIEKSQNEDVKPEETQEEELFEIKQPDDEPLLIIEPTVKTEENIAQERNFIDPIETLEPQIEIAEEGTFNLNEPDITSNDIEEIVEKEPETPRIQESEKDTLKFNSMAEKLHSSNKPQNKRRKQKSKKGKPSSIQIAKSKPEPSIEAQKEITNKPEMIKRPSTPPAPEVILHFNSQEVSHELGLPHNLVKELVVDFKTDTLLHVDEISNAISSFDTTTWQELAKEYKGISDNLRLNEISTELQVLIRTNDAQKAKTALSRYRNYVNQL